MSSGGPSRGSNGVAPISDEEIEELVNIYSNYPDAKPDNKFPDLGKNSRGHIWAAAALVLPGLQIQELSTAGNLPPLRIFVHDGPRTADEGLEAWETRIRLSTENMNIERKVLPLLPQADQFGEREDYERAFLTTIGRLMPNILKHKQLLATGKGGYYDLWKAKKNARQINNSVKRSDAVENLRNDLLSVGQPRFPTPPPVEDSGDELYDTEHDGTPSRLQDPNFSLSYYQYVKDQGYLPHQLAALGGRGPVPNEEVYSDTSEDEEVYLDTSEDENEENAKDKQQGPPGSNTNQGGKAGGVDDRFRQLRNLRPAGDNASEDDPPTRSLLRCENCTRKKLLCDIKDTGVPCTACQQSKTVSDRETCGAVIATEKKKGVQLFNGRCASCQKGRRKCSSRQSRSYPCERCVKMGKECLPRYKNEARAGSQGLAIRPRRRRSESPPPERAGFERERDPVMRSAAAFNGTPCDNCRNYAFIRTCDANRPCQACTDAGEEHLCVYNIYQPPRQRNMFPNSTYTDDFPAFAFEEADQLTFRDANEMGLYAFAPEPQRVPGFQASGENNQTPFASQRRQAQYSNFFQPASASTSALREAGALWTTREPSLSFSANATPGGSGPQTPAGDADMNYDIDMDWAEPNGIMDPSGGRDWPGNSVVSNTSSSSVNFDGLAFRPKPGSFPVHVTNYAGDGNGELPDSAAIGNAPPSTTPPGVSTEPLAEEGRSPGSDILTKTQIVLRESASRLRPLENYRQCDEIVEAFKEQPGRAFCTRSPAKDCDNFEHEGEWSFNTCARCHDDQNQFYRLVDSNSIEQSKLYWCQDCTAEIQNQQPGTDNFGPQSKNFCICLRQLNKSWLCHLHRADAHRILFANGMKAIAEAMNQFGGGGSFCPRCAAVHQRWTPTYKVPIWTCMTCKQTVLVDVNNPTDL